MDIANPLKDKSYSFAVRMVQAVKVLCDQMREYVLSKQVLRSGTSIGANVAEANGAISKDEVLLIYQLPIRWLREQNFGWTC